MRRNIAPFALPAAILLLALVGCSSDDGGPTPSPADGEMNAAFSECPVTVEAVGTGDTWEGVRVTSGVFYPSTDSVHAFEFDEVQDVATPVSMIEKGERFCATGSEDKVSTWANDLPVELTPVLLESGESVYIEGEISAPFDGSSGSARLTADADFITDEVRAEAESLESEKSEADDTQQKPARMSVASSSPQVARCTLYTGGGSPANKAQGTITVRYDGDERTLTVPDGAWDSAEPFEDGTTVEAKRVEITVSTKTAVDITTKDLSCVYLGDDGTSVVEAALN